MFRPREELVERRTEGLAPHGQVVLDLRRHLCVDDARDDAVAFELQVMGTFEIREGKIKAWRDYFDQSQFTSRMG